MIVCAPASFAPCTTLRPTPPQPTTSTVDPASTFACRIAAPTPVARAFSGVSSDAVPRPENGPAAVTTPADPQTSLVHDVRFALVDRRARIRGYYSGLDPEAIARLRQDVRTLLAYKE